MSRACVPSSRSTIRPSSIGGSRDLSDPLEALVIEHYADRDMQRPLLSLLARQLDNFERYPKYRTRKLFDLLYADLKAGRDTLHYATLIIATDQPVDAELTALLAQLDPAAANELVMFLGHRKYAAALPALQALQAAVGGLEHPALRQPAAGR
jgi:hypothetical protein